MKNIIRFILPMLIAIVFLAQPSQVNAASNTISKIEMNVYIGNDGTASIEEIWYASLSEGTEGYKPYGNLGESSIQDFTVTDDTGAAYETLSTWDINKDFYGKAHKSGLNYTPDGVELCWGISEYGDRVYTLRYKITNFVSQYDDAQAVYFSLMPVEMDQSPGSVSVSITSDVEFSEATAKIWGFGYEGEIVFEDGAIVMNTQSTLSTSDYMVALIKFEDAYFNVPGMINEPFQAVYDRAMEGSDYGETISQGSPGYAGGSGYGGYGGEMPSGAVNMPNILASMFGFFLNFLPFLLVPIIWILVRFKKNGSGHAKRNGLDFGEAGLKIPSIKNIDYWRDIPCGKDIEQAYWVIYNYRIATENDSRSGLIGAILLDWLRQGHIQIVKLPKKIFSFKDNNYAVDLSAVQTVESGPEQELLVMFRRAAGSNSVLEPNEFGKWCEKHYDEIDSWFDAVTVYAEKQLVDQQFLTVKTEPSTTLLGKLFGWTVTVKTVALTMRDEAMRLQGLKRFLLDFSIIGEREAVEVHLLEEYLIFAQLLGIADKVQEQFRKVYPDFGQYSQMDMDVNMATAIRIAAIGYESARSGQANASTSSGISGGGGFSSSGGGGGSSGGSSGGGFR